MIQETHEQQQIYNLFRSCIYIFLILELIVNMPIGIGSSIMQGFIAILGKLEVFGSVVICKVLELICVIITCVGTTARRSLNFDVHKKVTYPCIMGILLSVLCCFLQPGHWGPVLGYYSINRILYLMTSVLGIMLVHKGLDGMAQYFNCKLGEDRFNFENESFQQCEQLVNNKYSVNIPMIYYYKGRMHNGWCNISNPFRGTWVVGTPGSGKSFSVIEPFIRQHSAKGFSMVVYDYKFPALAEMTFYHFNKNKMLGNIPENMEFNIINFTDVEYSNRVNPIQKKYIPDLSAASETAATLLAALNKGSGQAGGGGSDKFFTNSAENFLAAIIYFFITFHPVAWRNGKKLHHCIIYDGHKYEIRIVMWNDYIAVDEKGNVVLDFIDKDGRHLSVDEDGMPVTLKDFSYVDREGKLIIIEDEFYEDDCGERVEPDTFTGEYSDMPHVLSFLQHSYDDVFNILMQDETIMSLMAPFKSAYDNNAMDQLEGMVGTLRVNAARLVSQEAYWVFS
ncbi:MAG: type IV secretory system conjugative DNA transfer family protein, partial [Prevotella sp.]|nr:type IV secretory system conjugative DNA transfer family protein [Prevotella sp.]